MSSKHVTCCMSPAQQWSLNPGKHPGELCLCMQERVERGVQQLPPCRCSNMWYALSGRQRRLLLQRDAHSVSGVTHAKVSTG